MSARLIARRESSKISPDDDDALSMVVESKSLIPGDTIDSHDDLDRVDLHASHLKSLDHIDSKPITEINGPDEFLSIDPDYDLKKNRPYFALGGIKIELLRRIKEYLNVQKHFHYTVYDVCEKYIKPWTSRDECSFVDFLQLRYQRKQFPELTINYSDSCSDKSNIYVSYAWNTNFVAFVEALENFSIENLEYIYWIDLFCFNQHTTLHDSKLWYPALLRTSLKNMGSILLVLSNWKNSSKYNCFTRIWCLYELYAAFTNNVSIQFKVCLHPKEIPQLDEMILQNIDALYNLFGIANFEESKSTSPDDKGMILEYLDTNHESNSTTLSIFEQCNLIVTRGMKKWLVEYGMVVFSHSTNPDDYDLKDYSGDKLKLLNTMTRFAHTLGELQKYENAELIYLRVLNCYTYLLGKDHVTTLGVKNNLSYLLFENNKLAEASTMAIEVAEGYMRIHGNEHQNTMVAALHAGDVLKASRDYVKAEKYYRTGLVMCDKILSPTHLKTLDLLNKMGVVQTQQGKLREALRMHTNALNGYLKHLGDGHLMTGETAMYLGEIYMRRHDWEAAIDMYELACHAVDSSGGSSHDLMDVARRNLQYSRMQYEQYANVRAVLRFCVIS